MKIKSRRLLAIVLCMVIFISASPITSAQAINAVKSFEVDSVSSEEIVVSWSKVNEADGYRIFRYVLSEKKWKAVKTTKELSYTDKDVEPSEVYYYVVRAYQYVDSVAQFSKNSNTVKVIVPPSKVTGLKMTSATKNSISLTWNQQQKATGYLVYIYNVSAKKYQQKANVTVNSCTITGLNEGTTYTFAVKAYTKHGSYAYGDFSSVLRAATLGPQVPTNLKGTAQNENNCIKLVWNGASSNGGYVIYFYNPTTGSWDKIGNTKATSYTVNNITETGSYTYAVASYTGSDNDISYSAKSDSVTVNYLTTDDAENIDDQELAEKGILGYLYDSQEKCFYTASDPWQRLIGYNVIFDVCAPIAFISFDTVRFDFDYKDKDWRIQLWKGQYGLAFYGCEVGVYTKPQDRKLAHYNCASDDELLNMELTFYQKKTTLSGEGWVPKFSRPYGAYWWCTGFIPGNIFGNFDQLKLEMRITMKDYEMLSGFTEALDENDFRYTVKGLDVYFMYE